MPAVSNASENHLGAVGGHIVKVPVTITGHAGVGAYIAGDIVGPITEVPLLARVVGGSLYLTELRLITNKKSVVPRFRVHFFNAANPTVAADDAQHKELYTDNAKRLGYVDLPAMTTAIDAASSDCSRSVVLVSPVKPLTAAAATRSVWVLLEVLDGLTPADTATYYLVICGDQT